MRSEFEVLCYSTVENGLFENRGRRIFGPKRGKVAGGCEQLHNYELQNFHCSTK
jgi:hypothetical protein